VVWIAHQQSGTVRHWRRHQVEIRAKAG